LSALAVLGGKVCGLERLRPLAVLQAGYVQDRFWVVVWVAEEGCSFSGFLERVAYLLRCCVRVGSHDERGGAGNVGGGETGSSDLSGVTG
jgi:hypothetical protein